jgi:hypothetical protein
MTAVPPAGSGSAPADGPKRGRTRLVAGLVLLLVALAGIGIGFTLDRALAHRRMMGFMTGDRPPGPPPGARRWVLDRLDRDLKLTPPQREQIDSVLARREADIRALMIEVRPRFEAISARTRQEIQAVLTPEQQTRFAAVARRFEFHPPHGPPHGP